MKKSFCFLIFIVFLITYHFYSFYQKNFFQMIRLIKDKDYQTLYEKIQSEQPYYEVWLLSKKPNRVFFIFEKRVNENLDYNTTYFKQKKGSRFNYYLSELKLNTDYFFYPRIIKSNSLYEIVINQQELKRGDYLVSDYELDDYWETINSKEYQCLEKSLAKKDYNNQFKKLYQRLKRLEVQRKNYISVIKHSEEIIYYIYQVVN